MLLISRYSLQIKKDATTIVAKIQAATDLFLPMNSSSTSLEEVTPSFSACFTFEEPDKRSTDFILELSSSPAAPTIYEKVQELWIRTGRRDNAVPLEVLMARLDRHVHPALFVTTFLTISLAALPGSLKSLLRTALTPVGSIPR